VELDMFAGGDRVHGASIFAVGRDGAFAFSAVEPGTFGARQLLFIRDFFHLNFLLWKWKKALFASARDRADAD